MYMLTILLAVVSVGLSVAIVILLRAGAVAADVSPMIEWAKEFESVRAHIADEVGRLEGEMETLRFAVAEGIAHVERTENRIKSTVQRARSQLKEHGLEHDGLEVESAEISRWDGGGGEGVAFAGVAGACAGGDAGADWVGAGVAGVFAVGAGEVVET